VSSFAVLGEALVDLRMVTGAEPAEKDRPTAHSYTAQPGGSPYNVAIGLARLGHRAEFAGRIAQDVLGGILRRHARQSGVSLGLSDSFPGPTPAALFDLNQDGSARYEFHLGDARETVFAASDAARFGTPAVDAVHFGSIASWLPGSAEAILEAVARLRRGGTFVSYDPNIRAALVQGRAATVTRIDQATAVSDLIKASVEDLAWLYPDRSVAEIAREWLERGALAVVVTYGAEGAEWYGTDSLFHGRSTAVHVVDTVGAGDAFMAGLLDGLAETDALSRDGLTKLPSRAPELQLLLDAACRHASATCMRPGADPPWRSIAQRLH
jgi:fructokinase